MQSVKLSMKGLYRQGLLLLPDSTTPANAPGVYVPQMRRRGAKNHTGRLPTLRGRGLKRLEEIIGLPPVLAGHRLYNAACS
jgi:hypothetical protein